MGSNASLIHLINMEMLNCILACIRPLLHFLQNTADWWLESFKGWYYALGMLLHDYKFVSSCEIIPARYQRPVVTTTILSAIGLFVAFRNITLMY